MKSPLIIGSRGSQLALCQAEIVRDLLLQGGAPHVEIRTFTTRGDQIQSKPLPEIGGKGLFTEALEEALLSGDIHVAVHSAKDVPTERPPGITIGAVLQRDPPYDVLVGPCKLDELPPGASVGTSSLRRRAQLLRHRPDLRVIDLRGNLDTRLQKAEAPDPPDAVILAEAGLVRMGWTSRITERLPIEVMLPAPAQGALAVECRADDPEVLKRLAAFDTASTRAEIEAERSLLARLEGGCHVPVGCLGRADGGRLVLRAGVYSPDGTLSVTGELEGPCEEAQDLGTRLAERLLPAGAAEILEALAN